MSETYLTLLNTDLIVVVVSYLDLHDFKNFSVNYDALINYKDLFLYKYPYFVRQNFNKYSPKGLYMGFLENEMYPAERRRTCDCVNCKDWQSLNSKMISMQIINFPVPSTIGPKKMEILFLTEDENFEKYVLFNSFIDFDDATIAEADDPEIFDELKDKINITNTFVNSVFFENFKLADHILNTCRDVIDVEFMKGEINNYYGDIDEINLETSKYWITRFPHLKLYILRVTYKNECGLDTFKYLIDITDLNKEEIIQLLKHGRSYENTHIKIKYIIDKYYNLIEDYISEFYMWFLGHLDEISPDDFKAITYLANLDIIKETYKF